MWGYYGVLPGDEGRDMTSEDGGCASSFERESGAPLIPNASLGFPIRGARRTAVRRPPCAVTMTIPRCDEAFLGTPDQSGASAGSRQARRESDAAVCWGSRRLVALGSRGKRFTEQGCGFSGDGTEHGGHRHCELCRARNARGEAVDGGANGRRDSAACHQSRAFTRAAKAAPAAVSPCRSGM